MTNAQAITDARLLLDRIEAATALQTALGKIDEWSDDQEKQYALSRDTIRAAQVSLGQSIDRIRADTVEG